MSLLHTPQYSSWARGHLVCRMEGVDDRFALTFDDGPSPRITPLLLDLLAARGARATFFLLAGNVRRRPDLIARMVAEGHEPAIHGDRHWPLALLPPAGIRGEIDRCARAIAAAAVSVPRHYRPPFGFMMPGQAAYVRHLGYLPVLGDVYPEDAQGPGVSPIVERVMRRLTGGSILILHDGSPQWGADRSQTLEAAGIILERVAARGLAAVTVRELLEPVAAPGTQAEVAGGRVRND